MALDIKPSLAKPCCAEHVGDLAFQCPVPLIASRAESKLHLSTDWSFMVWCSLFTVLTAYVLNKCSTGHVQYWVLIVLGAWY